MAAGLATLRLLDAAAYARLEALGARLEAGLARAARDTGVTAHVQRVASLLTLFFAQGPIRNEDDARTADRALFARFHGAMLARGVLLPPSQLECLFLSLAHTGEDVDAITSAAAGALRQLAA